MKYKLTKNTKTIGDITLYQIEALKDFGNISKGDLGGYIEKEGNLSQDGNAWVYGDAQVYGNAQVCGQAKVLGDARVSGNALVCGDARVYGQAFEATYKTIGKENGYSKDEAEMTAELVRAAMKRMTPIKKTVKITHEGQEYEIDIDKAKELGIVKSKK